MPKKIDNNNQINDNSPNASSSSQQSGSLQGRQILNRGCTKKNKYDVFVSSPFTFKDTTNIVASLFLEKIIEQMATNPFAGGGASQQGVDRATMNETLNTLKQTIASFFESALTDNAVNHINHIIEQKIAKKRASRITDYLTPRVINSCNNISVDQQRRIQEILSNPILADVIQKIRAHISQKVRVFFAVAPDSRVPVDTGSKLRTARAMAGNAAAICPSSSVTSSERAPPRIIRNDSNFTPEQGEFIRNVISIQEVTRILDRIRFIIPNARCFLVVSDGMKKDGATSQQDK